MSIVLVGLFGFSAVINMFANRGYIAKVGKYKITATDVMEMGGRDEKSFNSALQTLVYYAQIMTEADALGLIASDEDIQAHLKSMFKSRDGDGFSMDALQDYLQKRNMSKNGLVKLITLDIISQQMLAPLNLGLKIPPKFVDKVTDGMSREKSGYYLELSRSELKPEEVAKYAQPSMQDLFKYLLDEGDDMANYDCYVFKVQDGFDSKKSLPELLDKFKHEKARVDNGTVLTDNRSIDLSNIEFDMNTFMARIDDNNWIYYNPFTGKDMEQIKKGWLTTLSAMTAALKGMADAIKDELEKCTSAELKLKLLESKVFGNRKFKRVEGVSFSSCFQKQRCKKCASREEKCERCVHNDCMCEACFDELNDLFVSRPVAVSIMLGKLMEVSTYSNESGLTLCVVTEDKKIEPDEDASKSLSNALLAKLLLECKELLVLDIARRNSSMI